MSDTEIIVRNFYAALARGDAPAALTLLDADVEWNDAERSPYFAGGVRGVDAVVKTVLEPISRDYEGFACTPSDFVTQGDRTVSFGLYTGLSRGGGKPLRAPFAHLWTLYGGRIVRFQQYTDSAAWDESAPANHSGRDLR